MAKKQKYTGIVYSTNPDFEYQEDTREEASTIAPEKQMLYLSLDRKQRAGKVVSLIEGFVGTKADLEQLAKDLKNYCGTGGTAKNNEIIIQGDCREKIAKWLSSKAYRFKRKGGD